MKTFNKTLIALAIASLTSGAAYALDADSSAIASVSSSAISVGNGFASQTVTAAAQNGSGASQSSVTSYDLSLPTVGAQTTLKTDAATGGSTQTTSNGVQFGSAYNTGSAIAGQSGEASASVSGANPYGVAHVDSSASVASGSASFNINNGWTNNGSLAIAGNSSDASVGGTSTIGGTFFHPIVTGTTHNSSAYSDGGSVATTWDLGHHALGLSAAGATQEGHALAVAP